MHWGTTAFSLNWDATLSPALYLRTQAYYNQYSSVVDFHQNESEIYSASEHFRKTELDIAMRNVVADIGARTLFEWQPSANHHINFGFDAIHHHFPAVTPNVTLETVGKEGKLKATQKYQSSKEQKLLDLALFFEDQWQATEALSLALGARVPFYQAKGFNYLLFEPRLSVKYAFSPKWSVKLGYTHMSQYFSLLQPTTISYPTSLWVPITERYRPKQATQGQIGLYFEQAGFELSLEGFYKTMQHLLAYRDGEESFFSQVDWQDRVEQGSGTAYGADFLLRKVKGKLTGMVAYTLAWSQRHFTQGGINHGNPFWDRYDNRHHVTIALNYRFNKTIDCSALWTLSSGNRITLADHLGHNLEGETEPLISGRNNYQFPTYHRLDVGVNFTFGRAERQHILRIGAYNAYMQYNPFVVQMRNKRYPFPPEPSEKYHLNTFVLFPILPSISYTFKFN